MPNLKFRQQRRILVIAAFGLVVSSVGALAGPYASSSHGNGTTGVDRQTIDAKYSAYAIGNCAHCHEQHASLAGAEPAPVGGAPSRDLGFALEQNLCLECHDAGGPSSINISTQFAKTYKHGKNGSGGTDYMNTYDDRHNINETASTDFSGTQRHAECADCHNPHEATGANPLKGVSGVDPTNGAAGSAPAAFSFVSSLNDPALQYKVCFKCHTNWAGFGTGTNQAIEFNPANDSFHHVESDKYAYTVNTGTGKGIWQNAEFNLTYVDEMMVRSSFSYTHATLRVEPLRCSDCHGPNGADKGASVPEGVHGSTFNKILKVPAGSPYTTWNSTVNYQTNSGVIWCFNCHSPTFNNTGLSDPGNLHTNKHDDWACQYCHLAVPHGQTGSGTTNQRKHLLKPSVFTESVDSEQSGNWNEHGGWVIPGCT